MKSLMKAAIGGMALMLSTPSWAALVLNSDGTVTANNLAGPTSTTIDFNGPNGITSQLVLTLTGVSGNDYTFSYLLDMTNGVANLSGFGFDTNPSITGVSNVTGPLSFSTNTLYPDGVGTVDACLYSGNNCSSASGQATSFSGGFTLGFGSSPVTLSNFVDRYASVGGSGGSSAAGYEVSAVPEPATWALMLLGFGGIGLAMRRRRQPRLMQIA